MQAQNLQNAGFQSISPKVAYSGTEHSFSPRRETCNESVLRMLHLSLRFRSLETQIKDYLENPPQGVDPRLWKQAQVRVGVPSRGYKKSFKCLNFIPQLDNPDPKKLIPVPMIGFKALQQRIHCQEQQAKTFKARLIAVSDEISGNKLFCNSSEFEDNKRLVSVPFKTFKNAIRIQLQNSKTRGDGSWLWVTGSYTSWSSRKRRERSDSLFR